MLGVNKLGVPHEGDGKVSISTTTGFCNISISNKVRYNSNKRTIYGCVLDMFRLQVLYHQQ